MAGALVAEALAHGDLGLAVADPRARRGRDRDRDLGHRRAAAAPTSRRSPATTSRRPRWR